MAKTKSALLVEWMLGGGQYVDGEQVDPTMVEQGQMMLAAISRDFLSLGCETTILLDEIYSELCFGDVNRVLISSQKEFQVGLEGACEVADAILLIAPESQGRLAGLCQSVESYSEKLISPNLEFVELASDKSRTLEQLSKNGVRTVVGRRLDRWLEAASLESFPTPAILKPNCGAGGENLLLVSDWNSLIPKIERPDQWRVEEYHVGRSASASVIIDGRGEVCVLPPTFQTIEEGQWVGCECVNSTELRKRASQLAAATVAAMPATQGYFGIDLIFGTTSEEDAVVEVNPRLTSSFVKLSEQSPFSLAERMLAGTNAETSIH